MPLHFNNGIFLTKLLREPYIIKKYYVQSVMQFSVLCCTFVKTELCFL